MDSNNINFSELKLLLENHFSKTEKMLADFQKDNAEFKLQMNRDFMAFSEKMENRFAAFTEKIENRLTEINAEIVQVNYKITGMEHDISNLQMWNYWTLSIILAFAAMPHIVAGIKALFSALSEGVASINRVFKKGQKEE